MTGIFAVDWHTPFELFGRVHLITLAIIAGFNLSFLWFRNHSTPRSRRIFRWVIASVLLVNEAAWHIWNILAGTWTIQTMLPLHLCSVFVYLSAYMLVTRSEKVYA